MDVFACNTLSVMLLSVMCDNAAIRTHRERLDELQFVLFAISGNRHGRRWMFSHGIRLI